MNVITTTTTTTTTTTGSSLRHHLFQTPESEGDYLATPRPIKTEADGSDVKKKFPQKRARAHRTWGEAVRGPKAVIHYPEALEVLDFIDNHLELNHQRLLFTSLLIGMTTGTVHWQTIRHPALVEHLHENLRTFPVEISFGAVALLSFGALLSYGLYRHHLCGKERRARVAIRQRYIDYIVLCLMVSVANAARQHLHCPDKEGLGLQQLEGYRRDIEVAIARFRASARKLLQEPPLPLANSHTFLERYFRLDDERFGEEILSLKRDAGSLMNVPAIKGLLSRKYAPPVAKDICAGSRSIGCGCRRRQPTVNLLSGHRSDGQPAKGTESSCHLTPSDLALEP
uniref:Uncharacterized protein n=1 Tax=Anopheles merus TaxID=30066 RepID=A0A182UPJ5_ANOME